MKPAGFFEECAKVLKRRLLARELTEQPKERPIEHLPALRNTIVNFQPKQR